MTANCSSQHHCNAISANVTPTFEAGVMIGHVDVPCKSIGSKQAARRVTAAHDWLTYAPVTALSVQRQYIIHFVI